MSPKPPEEKVADLEARIATVKEEIAAKTARLKEVESERLREIQLRLRRARYAVTAKERKRRTRRLILMGTYVESKMNEDPAACERFMAALDGFLTQNRDRELFDLEPLPEDAG